MNERIVLVVAGNREEFWHHIEELSKEQPVIKVSLAQSRAYIGTKVYQYVDRAEHMRGFHGVEVEFWGTYYKRENIVELEQHAKIVRLL